MDDPSTPLSEASSPHITRRRRLFFGSGGGTTTVEDTSPNDDDGGLDEEDIEEMVEDWEEAEEEHDDGGLDEEDVEEMLEEWKEAEEEQEGNDDSKSNSLEDVLASEEEIEETMEAWENATAAHDAEWFAEYDATHDVAEYSSGASSVTGMVDESAETLEQIEEELQLDEQEAEAIDAAEDQELDEEGFEDGTDPIVNDDESEPKIDTSDTLDEDEIKEDLEDWEDIEAWKEATEEHDKEYFAEWEKEHSGEPKEETGIPDQSATKVYDNPGWTVEGGEKNDDDDNVVPAPVSTPTATEGGWSSPVSAPTFHPVGPGETILDCTGIVGQMHCGYAEYPLAVFAILAFVPMILLCCLRKYCRDKSNDTRGEYRAVAAQYGNMGYDNTFSDAYSDDEDDDFVNGDGDVEDDSWGKSGKRSLEMAGMGKQK